MVDLPNKIAYCYGIIPVLIKNKGNMTKRHTLLYNMVNRYKEGTRSSKSEDHNNNDIITELENMQCSHKCIVVLQNNNCSSFPKGHIEKNESGIECAFREFEEETNIDIKCIDILYNEPLIKIYYTTKKYGIEFKHITFWIGLLNEDEIINKYGSLESLINNKKKDKHSLGINIIDLNHNNYNLCNLNYHMKKKIPEINNIVNNYINNNYINNNKLKL